MTTNVQQYLDAAEENNRQNGATYSDWADFAARGESGETDCGAQHLYDTYRSTLPALTNKEIAELGWELEELQKAEEVTGASLESSNYCNDQYYSREQFEAMAAVCRANKWTMLKLTAHFKDGFPLPGFEGAMEEAAESAKKG
jgi:hypothetical protein